MKLYQVDAFTGEFFKGNPAGVCVLPRPGEANDVLMQNIAMEMNLSETAFLCKKGDEYDLRWFTPDTEVEFCGHATLSSAHVLWELGLEEPGCEITFNTKSGKLFARKMKDEIELNFPVFDVIETEPVDIINRALGVEPLFTGKNGYRYLVEIHDTAGLRNIKPDYGLLKTAGKLAFMVTCKSDDGEYDFYSRFFAPSVGIDEDPVTGSAHSYLAPYWSKKLDKNILNAYQASKRGGAMRCELTASGRVLLSGRAVTVFELEMRLPAV